MLKLDLNPFCFLPSTAFLPFGYNDLSFEGQSGFASLSECFLPVEKPVSFEVQPELGIAVVHLFVRSRSVTANIACGRSAIRPTLL